MLEKELLSIISLHKRFSLASVGVWLFLSILQIFIISEMFRLNEAYFLFVMAIPMLVGSGIIHLYRKFSVRTSLFSSVDIDIRLSLLLLIAAAMLQTFGLSESDDFTQVSMLVLSFLPGVLCLLALPAIFTRLKLESSNRIACKAMDHMLFTSLSIWLMWACFEIYVNKYLPVAFLTNSLVGSIPFFVRFVNRDVESRMAELLDNQVFTDELTGLGNRKALYRGFDQIKKDIQEGQSLLLMVVDIDYFKQYNDNYGHVQGDDCLVYVSRTLEEIFPDLKVTRFGGEEFIVFGVVDDHRLDKMEGSPFMKSWIAGEMTMDCEHKSSPLKLLSLSGGYGVFNPQEVKISNAKKLITLADEALYQAKKDRQMLVKVDEKDKTLALK
jgi:diguanylate cyclase (GGDEF)-like protein